MKIFWSLMMLLFISACTHKYVLIEDESYKNVSVETSFSESKIAEEMDVKNLDDMHDVRGISAEDVFVVAEGNDFVTYQYRNVIVSEISPMASLYCDDIAYGKSSYLREVSLFHNGFMRATFDCVDVAI